MNNKKQLFSVIICLVLVGCSTHKKSDDESILWNLNSLDNINTVKVERMGNPELIETLLGKAISFDGDGDRLLLDKNPLADATEFTIEVIFKPNDSYPQNSEPRFLHIESADNPSRRFTMELRLNDNHQWYLDAYIKSDNSSFTLIDATKVHPVNKWVHAAVTYKNGEFISYVNGQQELIGQVQYSPIPENAKTSIGARMNQIHWFNGTIYQVRVTKRALSPQEFSLITSKL